MVGAGGANLRSIPPCLTILAKPVSLLLWDGSIAGGWHEQAVKLGYRSEGDLPVRLGGVWLVLVTGLLALLWKLRAEHTSRWSLVSDWQRPGAGRMTALLGCSVCASAVLLSLLQLCRQSQVQFLWNKSSILAVPAPVSPGRFVFSLSRFSSCCSW